MIIQSINSIDIFAFVVILYYAYHITFDWTSKTVLVVTVSIPDLLLKMNKKLNTSSFDWMPVLGFS